MRHVEQCSHYSTASAVTSLMQSYAHFFYLTVGMNAGNSLEDRDKKERKTAFYRISGAASWGKCSKAELALSFDRKSCHRRYEPSSRALHSR